MFHVIKLYPTISDYTDLILIPPSFYYRTRFPIGGRINLPCTVNSYSRPTVFWKKNGQRMRSDRRVQGRERKRQLNANVTCILINSYTNQMCKP